MDKSRFKTTYLVLLMLALALAACSGAEPTPTESVDTAPAEDFFPVVSATGIVLPERWATFSFGSGGQVTELLVERGAFVEEGTLLAQLGNAEQARAALTGAELELINARQALDDLYENAALYTAQARLALANARDAGACADYYTPLRLAPNRSVEVSLGVAS